MNIPANFALNYKGFQLRDFAKKLSLTSYSLVLHFSTPKSAIFFSSQYSKLDHSVYYLYGSASINSTSAIESI